MKEKWCFPVTQRNWREKTVRLIKAFTLLTLISTMSVYAKSLDQSKKFNLIVNDASIIEVFEKIEKETGYGFVFDKTDLNTNKRYDLSAHDATLSEVLEKAFTNESLSFSILDNTVVVSNKSTNQQTQFVVKGKITDGTGESILGVNVYEKGNSSNGVITGNDGSYSITVANADATLVFSFIGFMSQEIKIDGKSTIDVVLTEEYFGLNEVVAIGYGSKTKGELTGAISKTSGKVLESRPVANTLNAIQGLIPGVTVTRSSGRPGQEDYQLKIRGASSVNGNVPLILIDGIPGDLTALNPNDIENITVLKDAAAAIYGARSADGVVLVTTKSGGKGQARFTYSGNVAVKSPSYVKNMATPYQLAKMFDEGRVNDGDPVKYTEEDYQKMLNNDPGVGPGRMLYLENYPNFYQNTEWGDVIFKNSLLQSHSVAVDGGNEEVKYMMSGGYLSNDGVFAFGENYSKRYNLRSNVAIKLRDNITLDTKIAYEHEDLVEPAETEVVLGAVCNAWSYVPVYNPAGHFYEYQGYANPAQWLEESGSIKAAKRTFRANGKLDWEFFKGLTFTGQAGVNVGNNDSQGFWRTFKTYNWEDQVNSIRRSPNMASYVDDRYWYKNFSAYLNYSKLIGEHNLGLMAGASHEEYDYTRKVMEGRDFPSDEVYPLSLANPTKLYANSRGYDWRMEDWALSSYFGRFSYSFGGKYYFDGTIRKDGSSKFAPDYRWSKAYPSASVAWKISEEGFLAGQEIFDLIKLRGSYGLSGNQDIRALGNYDYIQLMSVGGKYPMGTSNSTVAGARLKGMASPDRTWESIRNINAGIDFSTLSSRLNGSFDIYQKKNTDMLVDVTFPTTLGADAPSTNAGELVSKGWDFSIAWSDKKGDFSYSIGTVISFNENELTNLQGADGFNLGLTQFREGYPINSYFGYKTDGIIKNQQDLDSYSKYAGKGIVPTLGVDGHKGLGIGDIMYHDMDGDGAITTYGDKTQGFNGDAVYLGSADPKYTYGITADIKYKNFDFGMVWQGTGKKMVLRTGEFAMPYYYPWFQPYEYFYEKTWSPERADAPYPRISHADNVKYYNYAASDNMIENTAYLRLKNLRIGYTIPKDICQKISIENLRIYFSGEDLLEFTSGDWEGNYDPEEGQSYNSYPFYRAFSFGLDVKF